MSCFFIIYQEKLIFITFFKVNKFNQINTIVDLSNNRILYFALDLRAGRRIRPFPRANFFPRPAQSGWSCSIHNSCPSQ